MRHRRAELAGARTRMIEEPRRQVSKYWGEGIVPGDLGMCIFYQVRRVLRGTRELKQRLRYMSPMLPIPVQSLVLCQE